MRSKGMFMLDLLSNAVGANLILLFLFIAMTGAQPPRGGRPPDGTPRQPSLFIEVQAAEPATGFSMVLFPPPGVAPPAAPVEFTRMDVQGSPPRAIHVPELTQGCWRLGVMYLSTTQADELWAQPVDLDIEVWLAGLRTVDAQGVENWQGRIDVRWPDDASTFVPEATELFTKPLQLDPNKITTVDIHFIDASAPTPDASTCPVIHRSAFSP
ncbi:MAG: hypothetical protein MPN21_24230 [Thermoanaerobaculia bacterium]|nr:hypothetical protein [Thermoanaerobaculia bacterium]